MEPRPLLLAALAVCLLSGCSGSALRPDAPARSVAHLRAFLPAGAALYATCRPDALLAARSRVFRKLETAGIPLPEELRRELEGEGAGPLGSLLTARGWAEAGLSPAVPTVLSAGHVDAPGVAALRKALEASKAKGPIGPARPFRMRWVMAVADRAAAEAFARKVGDLEYAFARVSDDVLVIDLADGPQAAPPPLRPASVALPAHVPGLDWKPGGGALLAVRAVVSVLPLLEQELVLSELVQLLEFVREDEWKEAVQQVVQRLCGCDEAWRSLGEPRADLLQLGLDEEADVLALSLGIHLTRKEREKPRVAVADLPWQPIPDDAAVAARVRLDLSSSAGQGTAPPVAPSPECPVHASSGLLLDTAAWLRSAGPFSPLASTPWSFSLDVARGKAAVPHVQAVVEVAQPVDAVRQALGALGLVIPEEGTDRFPIFGPWGPTKLRLDEREGHARLVARNASKPGEPLAPVRPAEGEALLVRMDPAQVRGLLASQRGMEMAADGLELVAKYTDSVRLEGSVGADWETLRLRPVVGTLTLAVPAFQRYQQRARTSEATMHLRKMFDASVSYFEREHASRAGIILDRQFPRSVDLTPGKGFCGPGSQDGKWTPRKSYWRDPTWEALFFAVSDPHYYSYEYVSEGTGTSARFTARAVGDLDCDGVLSTFERVGAVDAALNVMGGGGIYVENELE